LLDDQADSTHSYYSPTSTEQQQHAPRAINLCGTRRGYTSTMYDSLWHSCAFQCCRCYGHWRRKRSDAWLRNRDGLTGAIIGSDDLVIAISKFTRMLYSLGGVFGHCPCKQVIQFGGHIAFSNGNLSPLCQRRYRSMEVLLDEVIATACAEDTVSTE
jgi:hypothetical protein